MDNYRATEHIKSIGDGVPEGVRIKIKPAGVYTEENTFTTNGQPGYKSATQDG